MNEQESVNSIVSFSWALQGFGFGVFLIFLSLLSLDLGRFSVGFVFFPLIGLFFWPLKASYSWSLVCVFLLGIFHDIVSNGPLGVWALAYLLVFVVLGGGALTRYQFSKSYMWFFLLQSIVLVFIYVIGRIVFAQSLGVWYLLISAITTLIMFPIVYWFRIILGLSSDEHLRSGVLYR